MNILKAAAIRDIRILLELYPVSSLREYWPDIPGKKEELSLEIAGGRNISAITKFVDEYFSCTRQHVYIYQHDGKLSNLPIIKLPDAEKVLEAKEKEEVHMLYLIRFEYRLIVRDPLQEISLTFLWPVRLEFTAKHLIVRFIILEKDIGTYIGGRRFYVDRRSTEEKSILQALEESVLDKLNLIPVDLNKGIKTLWGKGVIDSPQVRFKKTHSTSSEAMDEKLTIRHDAPDLYAIIVESPLFNTLFQMAEQKDRSVSAFSVDPSKGQISFPRYSETKGDTDYVVREILRYN